MKLRSLSLNLFRQHTSSHIEFSDGLVGVIGGNGAGKTTIVEAIGFAIYGSRALRGRIEDVRTRTAPVKTGRGKKEQDLRVDLSLEHDGVVFRIERSLTDASLFIGGEAQAVAVGGREVAARMSAIVGMTYEEFIATYCTEQKGLEFLSGKKGATEREKFIVRMMGYDRLEEVQELIRGDRKEKRAVLTGYEASLGSKEDVERRLELEKSELVGIKERHAEAQKTLQKVEGDFASLREKMERLENLRARYLREKENVQGAQVRLEERSRRLHDVTTSTALAEEELLKVLKPLSASQNLEEALSLVKRQLSVERDRLVAKQEEGRAIEVSWREAVSKASAERDIAKSQYAQLEKRVAKVGELQGGSDCPTCGQSLGESFDQVRKHFQGEQRTLAAKVRDLERAMKEVSVVPEAVGRIEVERNEIERKVKGFEAKLQELNLCVQLQAKIESLRKERGIIEGEMKVAEENKALASERMADLRFSEDEYNKEKGAHDAAQRLVEVARLNRVRLEGEVNTKEALIERTREELEKFTERQIEVEKLRREVRLCDECDRMVTEFRKYVNASIRPRMAELASEYLTDLTDGRYTSVELSEDFTPTVVEDGEAKTVISGGEEDILNLCMRISLSHMLAERAGQHFSLLILDEVFGSLDEGRRGNVLALLEKLRTRFEQIIIITHLDDVKDGVQHIIQVDYDEVSGRAEVRSEDLFEQVEAMTVNV
jgi:exonuclease SbcC